MPSTTKPAPTAGFDSLGLNESLLKAVTALGYEEPTPVQRATIPLILSGTDLLDRRSMALKDQLSPRYADLVYEGRWWGTEREALDALVDRTQQRVTG